MRVLIVDDSAPFRLLLRTCLAGFPDVNIVGVAADGEQALQMIEQVNPDVVTLDMQMPRMHGLQVLEYIGKHHPELKVIMVASSTETDAKQTLQALELGAFDFITKPGADVADAKQYLCEKLQQELRQAKSVQAVMQKSTHQAKPTAATSASAPRAKPVGSARPAGGTGAFVADVVAIGASTGGPAALQAVLSALPETFAAPIVVTQHMPKAFIPPLVSRLNQHAKLQCKVAEQGEGLQAGHIYVAPGDVHTKVVRGAGGKLTVALAEGARVNHAIPSVDVTYQSLEALSPAVKTLAVVLTGMGNDGAAGARCLADKGNVVVVQDEQSSVVWGMAGETFRQGAAREVLPLAQIPQALMRYTGGI